MTEGPSLTVFVPGRLVNPLNQRWHWAERAQWARRWRQNTALSVGSQRHVLIGHGYRTFFTNFIQRPKAITFVAHVARRFDPDGLSAALKPCLDGLGQGRADAKMIASDGPDAGHTVSYEQVLDRRIQGVEITIALL